MIALCPSSEHLRVAKSGDPPRTWDHNMVGELLQTADNESRSRMGSVCRMRHQNVFPSIDHLTRVGPDMTCQLKTIMVLVVLPIAAKISHITTLSFDIGFTMAIKNVVKSMMR